MGFHTDDLMHVNAQYEEKFKKYHYTEIVFIVIGLMLITLIVLMLVRRGARLEKEYLHQEEAIFTQLFKISDEGILILKEDGTALYRNDVVDKVFGYEIGRFIVNGRLVLPNVNESTFLLQNSSGRNYYVEINSNQVYYHGTDSRIYFLKDVTEQYLLANEYERLSLLDELTGLSNRRALSNYFEDACFDESKQSELLLAIIDLDHFKDINDQYGHDVGDRVIQILGEVFTDRLRATDQFYRYGGEEFVAELPVVDIESGKELLEEINKRFEIEVLQELSFSCTFSGGLIQVDWSEECSLSHYVKQADRLLYKAKDNGRKRIEI